MAPIGEPFVVLDSVDSTNIHAMQLASRQEVGHGTVFFAHTQTAGKGQWGRSWDAQTGSSILLSAVVDPAYIQGSTRFHLSMAAALAGIALLRELHCGEALIKWPNDLYWHDRKAGGILIEHAVRGGLCRHSVIGMGINLNQSSFDPSLPNPVSVFQATGIRNDPVLQARRLCQLLEAEWRRLASGAYDAVVSDYNERLFGKGRPMAFRAANVRFSGIIEGVDAEGIITVGRPLPTSYRHGELEFILSER